MRFEVLRLFNNILDTGKILDDWTISKITMIPFKKLGYSSDPAEYRSISLTSCLSKLFEKLVHSRIYSYLE